MSDRTIHEWRQEKGFTVEQWSKLLSDVIKISEKIALYSSTIVGSGTSRRAFKLTGGKISLYPIFSPHNIVFNSCEIEHSISIVESEEGPIFLPGSESGPVDFSHGSSSAARTGYFWLFH
jgi:hypothetical protein